MDQGRAARPSTTDRQCLQARRNRNAPTFSTLSSSGLIRSCIIVPRHSTRTNSAGGAVCACVSGAVNVRVIRDRASTQSRRPGSTLLPCNRLAMSAPMRQRHADKKGPHRQTRIDAAGRVSAPCRDRTRNSNAPPLDCLLPHRPGLLRRRNLLRPACRTRTIERIRIRSRHPSSHADRSHRYRALVQ